VAGQNVIPRLARKSMFSFSNNNETVGLALRHLVILKHLYAKMNQIFYRGQLEVSKGIKQVVE